MHSVVEGPKGRMWFAHYDGTGGISIYDYKADKWDTISVGDIGRSAEVAQGFTSEEERLRKRRRFPLTSYQGHMIYNRRLFVDSKGLVWDGFYGGGVSVWDGKSWKTYSERDGLADNRVHMFTELPDGDILVGLNGAISRFDRDEGQWTSHWPSRRFRRRFRTVFHDVRRERVWFGGDGGLVFYDLKTDKVDTDTDRLVMRCVESITQVASGDLWVGSWYYRGLARFDGKEWTHYLIKTDVEGDYTPQNWRKFLSRR
jgi:ligand-binding sensor domain-containing protein